MRLKSQQKAVLDLIEDPQPPPYHITVEGRRFAFTARTFLVQGHSAYMPGALREVEAAGQLPLLVEREDRYLLYIHDPVVEAEAAAEAEAEAAN